jgi:hypothetical protein
MLSRPHIIEKNIKRNPHTINIAGTQVAIIVMEMRPLLISFHHNNAI